MHTCGVRERRGDIASGGSAGSYGSQTANGMALALGVAPDSARAAALAALVADIKARGNVQTGGDIGHKWILNALSDGNETSVLYAIHTSTAYPSYGYILGLVRTPSSCPFHALPVSSSHFSATLPSVLRSLHSRSSCIPPPLHQCPPSLFFLSDRRTPLLLMLRRVRRRCLSSGTVEALSCTPCWGT